MTFSTKTGIAASAATGAVLSMLADIVQKEDGAATLKISKALGKIWPGVTPLGAVILILVLAIIIAFIFAKENDKLEHAFFRGLSVLSLVMLITPIQQAPTLPQSAPGRTVGGSVLGTGIAASMWTPGRAAIGANFAQAAPEGALVPVHVRLETSDRRPVSQVTAILVDSSTSKVVGNLRRDAGEFTFFTRAGDYLLRVEVPGYGIVTQNIRVVTGQRNLIQIRLNTTWLPLVFQRLLKPAF